MKPAMEIIFSYKSLKSGIGRGKNLLQMYRQHWIWRGHQTGVSRHCIMNGLLDAKDEESAQDIDFFSFSDIFVVFRISLLCVRFEL